MKKMASNIMSLTKEKTITHHLMNNGTSYAMCLVIFFSSRSPIYTETGALIIVSLVEFPSSLIILREPEDPAAPG